MSHTNPYNQPDDPLHTGLMDIAPSAIPCPECSGTVMRVMDYRVTGSKNTAERADVGTPKIQCLPCGYVVTLWTFERMLDSKRNAVIPPTKAPQATTHHTPTPHEIPSAPADTNSGEQAP